MFCPEEAETVNHILFQCSLSRQIWALANIPNPNNGFTSSIFQNVHYLLSLRNRKDVGEEAKAVAPWLLWILWKNRNTYMFEGKYFPPNETVEKAYEDARHWFHAQVRYREENEGMEVKQSVWIRPERGRLKCNIGFAWSQQKIISGASWVLRDSQGTILLHSRQSFTHISSCFDAKIRSWEWALESMRSLRKRNVTFAASSMEVIRALHKPKEWPAFRGYIAKLLDITVNQEGWDISFEEKKANRGATEIAKTVISELRLNSYVAEGAPSWLRGFFEDESANIMV